MKALSVYLFFFCHLAFAEREQEAVFKDYLSNELFDGLEVEPAFLRNITSGIQGSNEKEVFFYIKDFSKTIVFLDGGSSLDWKTMKELSERIKSSGKVPVIVYITKANKDFEDEKLRIQQHSMEFGFVKIHVIKGSENVAFAKIFPLEPIDNHKIPDK